MKAYSQDLCERVVRAVASGQSKTHVARTFSVSLASVKKYVQLHENGQSLRPRTSPGRPSLVRVDQLPDLRRQLETTPDATLAEHVATWEQSHGVRLSVWAMFRAIRRLRWTYKKRVWRPASRTRSRAPRSVRSLPTSIRSVSSLLTRRPPRLLSPAATRGHPVIAVPSDMSRRTTVCPPRSWPPSPSMASAPR